MAKIRSPLAAAAMFTSAGVSHFAKPDFFEAIVPDWFPNARLTNQVSGAAELVLGLGLLVPKTRRLSAYGLIALLVIVFPANIDMAVNRVEVKKVDGKMTRSVGTAKGPQNWVRLPMQIPVALGLWKLARSTSTPSFS
jgi:uncharacterized membrane protein